jgi:hypothetical protein
MNCLEHCLEQWIDMPDYRLWYNSSHVVIVEPEHRLNDIGYLPLEHFGLSHFLESFHLDMRYREILTKYFDQ